MSEDERCTQLPKYFPGYWPQLMIFTDKHSTSHYLCENQDAVGRACLMVLKERLDPRYGDIQRNRTVYLHPGPESEIYGLQEELSKEAAEALPEPYRKQALNVIKENAKRRAEWTQAVELFKNAKKAIKTKDGDLAFLILLARRDYEYEGYTFEAPIVP